MPRRVHLALAVLAALPVVARAQPADHASQIRAFEAFAEEKIQSLGITGLSVAVMKDDFVWSRGFGWADVENQVPAKAESSYRMGSITKPMTAVGVLALVEAGKVDLDAEVQAYVPYFPRKPQPVLVRQLLSHLGGVSHYRDYQKEGLIREPKNTREALAIFQEFDLVAEPGTRYSYSSYGFNLLGAVIEGASGKSYGDFMRETVWQPLGMADTRMDDPRAIIPNRVRGYDRADGKLRNSEYVNISSRFAAGGTRSTVLDLMKLVRGISAGRVLKKETVEDMWTERATRGGTGIRYGLGWTIGAGGGRFRVGHTGSQQETRTQLSYIPRQRFAIALASNYEDARLGVFVSKLAELFLGDVDVELYTEEKAARPALAAVSGAFAEGLADYDRYGRPRTEDATQLAAAFRYFNEAVSDERMARQGRDAATGRPWATVGSYMAHALVSAGKANLETYQRESPLRLFADYIALYRSRRGWPPATRFTAATERRIETWAADWARAWPAAPLREIADASDLARVEAARERWRVSSVRPAYRSLIAFAEESAVQGNVALGTRAAALATELYPDSDEAHGILGVLAVMADDRARGEALIRKAADRARGGYVSPSNLAAIATTLARRGAREAAIALLEIGAGVHPSDAMLQVRLGQLYRDAGDPDKARAAYEAALRIDPASKEAQAGLAEVRH